MNLRYFAWLKEEDKKKKREGLDEIVRICERCGIYDPEIVVDENCPEDEIIFEINGKEVARIKNVKDSE